MPQQEISLPHCLQYNNTSDRKLVIDTHKKLSASISLKKLRVRTVLRQCWSNHIEFL